MYCFKDKCDSFGQETESFNLINKNPNGQYQQTFTQSNLISQNQQTNEIIFELIDSKEKMTRKFKIIDKDCDTFYQLLQNVINKEYSQDNKINDDNDPMNQTKNLSLSLIYGFIRFQLKIINNINKIIIPQIIIELCHNYCNYNDKQIIAVFFKNKGLQFVPMINNKMKNNNFVNIEITSICCKYPKYFKKWNLKSNKIKELQEKYHQCTYIKNIKRNKLPKLFTFHPLFIKYFGHKKNSNFSVILTSYFSFIIFDGLSLKMKINENDKNDTMKGIEFKLPNCVNNNYDELDYFKMEYSSIHGLIAYKDIDIYRLNIHLYKSYDQEIVWRKLMEFDDIKLISITSICWLTENKLFLCGKSALILDIKKQRYYSLSNINLDQFILFPSAINYDFNNNQVFIIGGSHQKKAQFYDITKSKWITLNKTNYDHIGKDCAILSWFIDNILYISSFIDGKILIEKLDTNHVNNKWIICDSSAISQYLDFNVWNFGVFH